MRVWPGAPFPLGATWDGEGTNFSLFSEHAEHVELCLFDDGKETSVPLAERTAFNWHCYLPDIGPGQRYAYRVHGPWAPHDGHRFNATKLLIDPYAKAIDGPVDWDAASTLPYVPGGEDADLEADDEDDAAAIPKCIVIDPTFDWEGDEHLRTPWHDTVIYEVHVKGFTARHPSVRDDLRGHYGGLASDEALAHLTSLGVTAVELLPIHHIADEHHLVEKGLTNYWGYSSIGYLAPHALYAATGSDGAQVREFKGMVKALHRAGIEVILDVVYNHTAEGNHLGPMLGFKGVDNRSYYRLMPDDQRYYMDFTGTGNSLNPVHPSVLRLIMDSLRYWTMDCHVDGFRFDLASALAREFYDVDRLSAFFDTIHQDPVLSQVKLIAEPWDLGPGGYQVGQYPGGWIEWNDKYRDTIRRFWRGDGGTVSEMATRIAGSNDLYAHSGRQPYASINFITAHDGFTLHDLVSYNEKHNEANGEENRDGENNNLSWNSGAEGPTDDAAVTAVRERQKRNFLATLMLSQGVPMISHGDEMSRTQQGNNNAYCQDNEITWVDWTLDEHKRALLTFTGKLVRLRHSQPVLRRRKYFQGRSIRGGDVKDVAWLAPDGHEMTDEAWNADFVRALGMLLNGGAIEEVNERGQPIIGDSLLALFNAHSDKVPFTLPPLEANQQWRRVFDTFDAHGVDRIYKPGGRYPLEGRSVAVFRIVPPVRDRRRHHEQERQAVPEPAAAER